MREMLEACRASTGGSAAFTWVDDRFLQEHEVRLPFWYPEETDGYDLVDNRRAVAQGLTFRPLTRTIRDVHAWVAENPEARMPDDVLPSEREAGLLRKLKPRLV